MRNENDFINATDFLSGSTNISQIPNQFCITLEIHLIYSLNVVARTPLNIHY